VARPSYAQFGEDTRLWEFFPNKTDGHYIDIGANDPIVDSVSKSFYDAGWRGINVEPLPHLARLLRAEQPESITYQAALGEVEGTAPLYFDMNRHGLSTLEQHNASRGGLQSQQNVTVLTLEGICDSSVQWPIDWMKIDVEGWEKQVIVGGDWKKYRPTVLVIEATVPNSKIPAHAEWEPLLLKEGYTLLDFDGLNRWYADAKG
jgi:FkbM family methyltransferase